MSDCKDYLFALILLQFLIVLAFIALTDNPFYLCLVIIFYAGCAMGIATIVDNVKYRKAKEAKE